MPEAPKQNFFAKLFASNAMIDPDQLCKYFYTEKQKVLYMNILYL